MNNLKSPGLTLYAKLEKNERYVYILLDFFLSSNKHSIFGNVYQWRWYLHALIHSAPFHSRTQWLETTCEKSQKEDSLHLLKENSILFQLEAVSVKVQKLLIYSS